MGVRTAPEILNKVPAEVLIKNFDFAGDDLAAGEVITAVLSVVVTPSGAGHLAVNGVAGADTEVQLTISLGVLYVAYTIEILAQTSAGQKLSGLARMAVLPA